MRRERRDKARAVYEERDERQGPCRL
jgi:hypothetical protein